MWLFTRHGIYSVVADRNVDGNVMVRSRARVDLDNLRRAAVARGFAWFTKDRILETPDGDYRFRVSMDRDAWRALVNGMIDDLTYDNFKNSVHERVPDDKNRHNLLYAVWSSMSAWQRQNFPRATLVAERFRRSDDDDPWTADEYRTWARGNVEQSGSVDVFDDAPQLSLGLDGVDDGIPGNYRSYHWNLDEL